MPGDKQATCKSGVRDGPWAKEAWKKIDPGVKRSRDGHWLEIVSWCVLSFAERDLAAYVDADTKTDTGVGRDRSRPCAGQWRFTPVVRVGCHGNPSPYTYVHVKARIRVRVTLTPGYKGGVAV